MLLRHGLGMQATMFVGSAACHLTDAHLMANTRARTAQSCGGYAGMRFICSASQNGCQHRQNSGARFAGATGSSKLLHQLRQGRDLVGKVGESKLKLNTRNLI